MADIIDYKKFSIIVEDTKLNELESILLSFSEEDLLQKQAYALKFRDAQLW